MEINNVVLRDAAPVTLKPRRAVKAALATSPAAPGGVAAPVAALPPAAAPSSFVRLATLNVNAHVEKKSGMSYLSWAWAWDYLLRQDGDAGFVYGEPTVYPDGTVMVYCTVTAFGKARTAHLPVMDNRNKPIAQPSSFAVNTSMQRCLVKAIALHGLGLYLYAGEDLPVGGADEAPAVVEAPKPEGYDAMVAGAERAATGGTQALQDYARAGIKDGAFALSTWQRLVERDAAYAVIKGAASDADAQGAR
jgi:hypothetical protein